MATLSKRIEELELLVCRLELTQSEINRAIKSSINQTIRAVATLVARGASKDARVKTRLIRQRMKVIASRRSLRAKLSILTFDIPAILLGASRSIGSGVRVGEHFVKGGFVRSPLRKRGVDRPLILQREGGASHPLKEMRVPIADAVDQNLAIMEANLEDRLLKNFERKIKLKGGLFR